MRTSGRDLARLERVGEILDMRKNGATYAQIGAAMGFTPARGYAVVKREIARRAGECRELADEIIELECDRLDGLFRAHYAAACGGDVAATAACLRIMQRRAAMLGLDRMPAARVDIGIRRGPEYFSDAELEAIVAGKPHDGDGGPDVI